MTNTTLDESKSILISRGVVSKVAFLSQWIRFPGNTDHVSVCVMQHGKGNMSLYTK